MTKNRTSMADIAMHAGVSTATVSRVFNGVGQVSEDTRRRVLTAIDELGYDRPPSERTPNTPTIGVIVPELTNPIFATFAHHLQEEISRAGGIALIRSQTPGATSEFDHLASLVDHHVDGHARVELPEPRLQQATGQPGRHPQLHRVLNEGRPRLGDRVAHDGVGVVHHLRGGGRRSDGAAQPHQPAVPGAGRLLQVRADPHDDALGRRLDGLQLGGDRVDPGGQVTRQDQTTQVIHGIDITINTVAGNSGGCGHGAGGQLLGLAGTHDLLSGVDQPTLNHRTVLGNGGGCDLRHSNPS